MATISASVNTSYAVDSSAAHTVTLPASPSAGDWVAIADYGNNFGTNNCTVDRNGNNIFGVASNYTIDTDGDAKRFTYIDATTGWIITRQRRSW